MDWLQVLSWLAVALLFAGLHVRKARPPRPFGVFESGAAGALIGGALVHVVEVEFVGYSVAALIVAALFAELAILTSMEIRSRSDRRANQ